MNIWDILQIEPTIDKKTIRRAYAARSRVVHPEENPEEFRTLYEAYQEALKYAQWRERSVNPPEEPESEKPETKDSEIRTAETSEEETGKPETEKTNTEDPEQEALADYFKENLQKQEERLVQFQEHWERFKNSYRTATAVKDLSDYLRSEKFQEIKWHPVVLDILTEAVGGDINSEEEILETIWDVYDFQEDGSGYEGNVKKLADFLRSKHSIWILRKQEQQQRELNKTLWKRLIMAFAILFLFAVPFLVYDFLTAEQRYVTNYMREMYPGEQFSRPERRDEPSEGIRIYDLYSKKYPELPITVEVSGSTLPGKYRSAEDDYRSILLKYYAEQYGLSYGIQSDRIGDRIVTLYYPDYDHIDEFCGLVAKMFREQEDLRILDEVGICPENIVFPDIMIRGGDIYFDLSKVQIYTLEELAEESELSDHIREAYVAYMFNYESWNLTDQQYRELGPVYEAMCMEWDSRRGDWVNLYDGEEKICRLFIAVYSTAEYNELFDGYTRWSNSTWITVGNIWHLFLVNGADVTVSEDRKGFRVEYEGKIGIFGAGTETSMRLNDVEKWY